jgi:hypothetical protein
MKPGLASRARPESSTVPRRVVLPAKRAMGFI